MRKENSGIVLAVQRDEEIMRLHERTELTDGAFLTKKPHYPRTDIRRIDQTLDSNPIDLPHRARYYSSLFERDGGALRCQRGHRLSVLPPWPRPHCRLPDRWCHHRTQ